MKNDTDTPAKTPVARRQRYSAEFKRRLVRMSLEPGVSAAKIALQHQLNANLLFKWRRLYLREISAAASEPVNLLPVTVKESDGESKPPPAGTVAACRSSGRTRAGTIDIELPAGRIQVTGIVDIELLRSVVQMVRG